MKQRKIKTALQNHNFTSFHRLRWSKSEVKIRTGHTVKHMAENGQKISGDDAAGITSLVPGVKKSTLRDCLAFDRTHQVYYGRSRTHCFCQVLANHAVTRTISNRSRDLA